MILTTERLVLREFVEEDWRAVQAYQSDPRYLRFYHWTERSEADVRAFVGMFIRSQQEQPRWRFQLAVTLKGTGDLIGNAGIRVNDFELGEANVGYELDPRQWGNGYATEAAATILRFGFEELKVHRVWADCLAANTASAHVLEKLGLRREAHFRQNQLIKGIWHDTFIYAILADEWRERRERGASS